MSAATRPLLILGAGDFAVELADMVSRVEAFAVAGFVQSVDPGQAEGRLEGLPVYWVEDIRHMAATHWAVAAIGSPRRRGFIERVAAMGFRFATVVHPSATVSPAGSLGEGTVVGAGAVIGTRARIGRHVILNRGALIGHHAEIGDYVTVGPGVNVAGRVRVGEGAFIGMGAVIKDHLEIGAEAMIGMGAVVTAGVPANTMVVAGATHRGTESSK